MYDQNPLGMLYEERPEIIIHERHRSSGSARELIALAKAQNYRISFGSGGFRNDLILVDPDTGHQDSYSLAVALRELRRKSG
jgi:hypothetical protein